MAAHEFSNSDSFGTSKGLLSFQEKSITSMLIKFKSNTSFQSLNIQRGINENTNVMATNPAFELSKLYNQLGVGINVLQWLGIFMAVVSGLSLFFSIFSSLQDRKYELALLRNWGSARQSIVLLLLAGGAIITFLGGVCGLIASPSGLGLVSSWQ